MRLAALLYAIGFWSAAPETINFDRYVQGRSPAGWAGSSSLHVRRDHSAPSQPNVLAQRSDGASPPALLEARTLQDGEISVYLKPVSGRESAGLVWRYQDDSNYYLVRANAQENNILVFKVQDGRWTSLALRGRGPESFGVSHKVPAQEWSILKVVFRGPRFRVYFGRRKVFEVEDFSFAGPGKVGLWTKAEGTTYFDNFHVAGR